MAERILLQGTEALFTDGDSGAMKTELAQLVAAIQHSTVQGLDAEALADNIKWKVSCGPNTVCIVELKPQLRRMMWIAADSPEPYGAEATYQERRLATPYIVLKVPFMKGRIVGRAELFYRNEPLRLLTDSLCWANLLNVSTNAHGCLAWICTQYLAHERPAPGITAGLHALVHHLFGGGFNQSSEHHEGQSAFGKAALDKIDSRVTDVDRWEAESVKDPRFILVVKWKEVGLTVGDVIVNELKQMGGARPLNNTAEVINALMSSRNGERKLK